MPDTSFEIIIRAKLEGISNALWAHVDGMEKTRSGPPISDDIEEVFAILLMTYEVFDHIGIDNISSNYYYAKGAHVGIQVNLGSEQSFKQALRLLLKIATSVIDIVSSTPLTKIEGIRRYAFSPHSYFFAFSDAALIQEFRASTWRGTVNLFRLSKRGKAGAAAITAVSDDTR